jgi:N-acetylglucosaminyldiphosphoundecaprenol N-acetyl-beta-D-mannosaminyltransferase
LPVSVTIGVLPVHPVRLDELLRWLQDRMSSHERVTVFYANVHAANLARRDAGFAAAYASADAVFCDGQGLRMGAALLGRPLPERFTPPDWIDRLLTLLPVRSGGLFLLGGRPGSVDMALGALRARHPGLCAAGHHGYFLGSDSEEQAVVDAVREFAPSLLLVGMGMPLQERWVADRRDQLAAGVVMTVGALIDHLAGTASRGPRWLTDNGLEWLCRLWFEPRRLWRRYLLGNPAFLVATARQMLAERGRGARDARSGGSHLAGGAGPEEGEIGPSVGCRPGVPRPEEHPRRTGEDPQVFREGRSGRVGLVEGAELRGAQSDASRHLPRPGDAGTDVMAQGREPAHARGLLDGERARADQ